MARIAIVTDSNSGINQAAGKELGISVLPMPFYIDGALFLEDITLSQEAFYEYLERDADISTSQPALGDVTALWDKLLADHDEIVHIPMSSGLSSSCQSALMLADDYGGSPSPSAAPCSTPSNWPGRARPPPKSVRSWNGGSLSRVSISVSKP